MSVSHELRGRLEGLRVKPRKEGTDVDVTLSFPLQQDGGLVDLAGLGELAGKQVIVEIRPLQAGLPLRAASSGAEK